MTLKIGEIALGQLPTIAAVLADSDVLMLNKEAVNEADILELRVDMFEKLTIDYVKEVFCEASGKFRKPIIGTVRHINEGGAKVIEDNLRLALYKAIIPLAEAIDIEVQCPLLISITRPLCSAQKTLLIGSYHNVGETPEDALLGCILNRSAALGVDVTKLVTTARSCDDMGRLLCFTLKNKSKNLITFAMGSVGMASRVFNPILGSLLTYGYITRPAAPGQLSVRELRHAFNQFVPELNQDSST
jgi:3-dehydroquinate dehydratase-1